MIKKDNKEQEIDQYKKAAKSAYSDIFSENKSSNKVKGNNSNNKYKIYTSDSASRVMKSSHSSWMVSQVNKILCELSNFAI